LTREQEGIEPYIVVQRRSIVELVCIFLLLNLYAVDCSLPQCIQPETSADQDASQKLGGAWIRLGIRTSEGNYTLSTIKIHTNDTHELPWMRRLRVFILCTVGFMHEIWCRVRRAIVEVLFERSGRFKNLGHTTLTAVTCAG
jgi:hypothetical protein